LGKKVTTGWGRGESCEISLESTASKKASEGEPSTLTRYARHKWAMEKDQETMPTIRRRQAAAMGKKQVKVEKIREVQQRVDKGE